VEKILLPLVPVVARKVYFFNALETLDSISLLVLLYVGSFDQLVFIEENFVRTLQTYWVYTLLSMRRYIYD
jgi:hypothetical protein